MRRLKRFQAVRNGQRAASFSVQVGTLALQALLLTAAILLASSAAFAGPVTTATPPPAADIEAVKRTAVALNYCRSSFYRIEKNPSPQVLAEERQKILNNLNLTSIEDEEVVGLYSGVLQEIGSIGISTRERGVVDASFGKSWQSLATVTAFGVLTDVTDMNYASLVKRGATSWWDYRGIEINRDMEMWKVEKARLNEVLAKSTGFLDASWKLARKRNIPDRWLLRHADFDRLELALREPDPEVRLRQLRRLEPFMECYPPYWYYVGRSQQSDAQFEEAERTYLKLVRLGDGHFRRDEMLAASMANVAAIRDYKKLAGAAEAAEKSLAYTSDSWEVNLTAAMVLMRNGSIDLAEEAVLRNLDSELETAQSSVAILAVYARQGDPQKILARLDDADVVNRTPIPVLLRCAAALKGRPLPTAVAERLQSSLHGYFGRDDFVLVADPSWELRNAQFAVEDPSQKRPVLHATERVVTVQFDRAAGAAQASTAGNEFDVLLRYSDDFQVKLKLGRGTTPLPIATARPSSRFEKFLAFVSERDRQREQESHTPRDTLTIASVETAGALIAFDGPIRALATTDTPAEPSPELAGSDGRKQSVDTVPVSATSEEMLPPYEATAPDASSTSPAVTLGIVEPLEDPSP